ncbi:brachyurin-like [Schistocerca serialis cubense]|uniref:brachyurin-like n=1 Tax=Schistocerca serialis cubense TaxID=2023355 RepID=UPI00214E81A8|nr:brachyurin-like [Schistocerca serialis cubense]
MKTTPVLALVAALVLASDARRLEANARPRKLPFSAARKAPGGRIVGGSDAAEGQFPFQAGLMIDGSGFCGGSLISTTAVLTAAHCVDAGSYFTVLLGSTYSRPTSGDNSQSFATTDTVRHSGFYTPDDNAAFYDVGLVRWSQPITITDYVTPIRLPSKAQASESFAGWDAIVSGWGLTSNDAWTVSSYLKYINVKIWTNADCQNIHGSDLVDDNAICAMGTQGQLPCNGDSGGPLSVQESDGQRTVVGVVSWGTANDCESGEPDVFMRVTAFLDWIGENAGITVS